MREIKFRAWHKERKFMDKVWLIDWEHDKVCFNSHNQSELSECELMQYTGLKDRNGVEIYEGDIFPPTERTQGEVTIVCYDSKQGRYKAVPLSLYNANAGNGGWTGYDLNQFSEVIGNVYEAKEE